MIEILDRLETNVQLLPDDGRLCSANTDPNPLYQFICDTHRALALCRICLAYYSSPEKNKPSQKWVEINSHRGGSEHSEPWVTYTSEVWLARRDRVVRLLVRYGSSLNAEYEEAESSYEANLGRRTRYRLVDIVYVLQAHMLLCAYAKMTTRERHAIGGTSAHENNAYVRRHELSIWTEPVGLYTSKQMVDALRHLCSCLNELPYDPQLNVYVLQLEMRSAMLLTTVETALVHDWHDYRSVVQESVSGVDTLYKISDILLSTLASASVAIYARLLVAQCLPSVKAHELDIEPISREMSQALRRWFADRASRQTSRVSNEWLRDRYIEMCLWPGEREFYRLENPRDTTATTLSILKKHRDLVDTGSVDIDRSVIKSRRTVQYAMIVASAERAPCDVIERDLSSEPGERESPLLQLALVQALALEAQKQWNGTDWFDYCSLARDIDAQIEAFLLEPDVPRVAQIFHHFQVVWRGRIVWYDSFIEAVCVWFQLMARQRGDLRPFHISSRISIELLAKEIFEHCQLRWWPIQKPPSDVTAPILKSPDSLYKF